MKQTPILEMKWRGDKGKTWEVVQMERPGQYMVRTTDRTRIGSMTALSIRAAFERNPAT